jgi:inner membrane protein
MASAFTHAFVAGALAPLAPSSVSRARMTVALMAASALPDLDVIGHHLGIPYAHPLGHRGLTHGLPFAAVLALILPELGFRELARGSREWWSAVALIFVATASHGVLDALTDGGLGVGFLVPLENSRHFFPFRPLQTSPLDPTRFFGARGAEILWGEIRWVWLPVALAAATVYGTRRAGRRR